MHELLPGPIPKTYLPVTVSVPTAEIRPPKVLRPDFLPHPMPKMSCLHLTVFVPAYDCLYLETMPRRIRGVNYYAVALLPAGISGIAYTVEDGPWLCSTAAVPGKNPNSRTLSPGL
jgi:hypothetical protein